MRTWPAIVAAVPTLFLATAVPASFVVGAGFTLGGAGTSGASGGHRLG